VTGDGLHELDVGAGSDETRHAGVAQIVEAIVRATESSESERRIPDALPEVRRLERRAAHRAEHELLGRVAAAFHCSSGELAECRVD
jgi:hypothetical protein